MLSNLDPNAEREFQSAYARVGQYGGVIALSDYEKTALLRVVYAHHEEIRELRQVKNELERAKNQFNNLSSQLMTVFEGVRALAREVPFATEHPQVSAILRILGDMPSNDPAIGTNTYPSPMPPPPLNPIPYSPVVTTVTTNKTTP